MCIFFFFFPNFYSAARTTKAQKRSRKYYVLCLGGYGVGIGPVWLPVMGDDRVGGFGGRAKLLSGLSLPV